MPEKVLLICTSTPVNIRKALGRFPNEVTFQQYVLDLLCTSRDLMGFADWPGVRQVLVFPKRKAYGAAFQLWMRILRQRYDVVVVFWCMEPGRALAKAFALVCNGRRVLVFNENIDCAFLFLGDICYNAQQEWKNKKRNLFDKQFHCQAPFSKNINTQ